MRTDLLYFFTHDYNANDAKTPKELYEAIENLGPLPRYLTRHDCTGKETRFAEPAVEEAKAVYLHARKIGNRIRASKPDLPPLPPTETDPFLGIQTVSEWCIEAELKPAGGKIPTLVSGDEKKPKTKISKQEVNVRVRELLTETPTWDWTARKLAKQIPCSLGWIPYLPAWKAYNERRGTLRREGRIHTVSMSKELELVLGTGEKDEIVRQLIAEQEGDQREDGRQAKLYLSQKNRPDHDRS